MENTQLDDKATVSRSVSSDLLDAVSELKTLALKEHYYCEDGWYSCPKAEGGCFNDAAGDECNCGAEAHNAKVEDIFARIKEGI
jgi:hypothetical protein